MASNSRVYFRGIDLANLANRYADGEFVNMSIPVPVDLSILKENSLQVISVQAPVIIPSCEINKGGHQNFICLGHLIGPTGTYRRVDPNKDLRCMNCARKITKEIMIQSGNKILTIPIRRDEQDGQIAYHGIDVFCKLECAYRKYEERKHNSLYQNSEIYLKEMFQMMTGRPCTEFRPASDPRILKFFNGPVDWNTYHKMSATYTENPTNPIIYPALEFIERSI